MFTQALGFPEDPDPFSEFDDSPQPPIGRFIKTIRNNMLGWYFRLSRISAPGSLPMRSNAPAKLRRACVTVRPPRASRAPSASADCSTASRFLNPEPNQSDGPAEQHEKESTGDAHGRQTAFPHLVSVALEEALRRYKQVENGIEEEHVREAQDQAGDQTLTEPAEE